MFAMLSNKNNYIFSLMNIGEYFVKQNWQNASNTNDS